MLELRAYPLDITKGPVSSFGDDQRRAEEATLSLPSILEALNEEDCGEVFWTLDVVVLEDRSTPPSFPNRIDKPFEEPPDDLVAKRFFKHVFVTKT